MSTTTTTTTTTRDRRDRYGPHGMGPISLWCAHRDEWVSDLDSNCRHDANRSIEVHRRCVSEDQCVDRGWSLTGDACYDDHITHSVPDVFLLSVILFLGTFTLAYAFRTFRTSRFFPTVVRFRIYFIFRIYFDLVDLVIYV